MRPRGALGAFVLGAYTWGPDDDGEIRSWELLPLLAAAADRRAEAQRAKSLAQSAFNAIEEALRANGHHDIANDLAVAARGAWPSFYDIEACLYSMRFKVDGPLSAAIYSAFCCARELRRDADLWIIGVDAGCVFGHLANLKNDWQNAADAMRSALFFA